MPFRIAFEIADIVVVTHGFGEDGLPDWTNLPGK
jgi:hypothetical protein